MEPAELAGLAIYFGVILLAVENFRTSRSRRLGGIDKIVAVGTYLREEIQAAGLTRSVGLSERTRGREIESPATVGAAAYGARGGRAS